MDARSESLSLVWRMHQDLFSYERSIFKQCQEYRVSVSGANAEGKPGKLSRFAGDDYGRTRLHAFGRSGRPLFRRLHPVAYLSLIFSPAISGYGQESSGLPRVEPSLPLFSTGRCADAGKRSAQEKAYKHCLHVSP